MECIDVNIEELFNDYNKALKDELGDVKAKSNRKSVDDIVKTMFRNISNCNYKSDWLKQNRILKSVCKKHGIKKSKELRELFKNNRDEVERVCLKKQ